MKKTKEEQKEERRYKIYGLQPGEFAGILKYQGGRCAVEGCSVTQETGRLCVDHVHKKGFKTMSPEEKRKYVRGIVCFMHNTGFKSFEKTVDGKRNRQSLEGTYKYFSKYPLKGEI